jgi:hypothetical protein
MKIAKVALLVIALTSTTFALNNKELAVTIDLSGKQRMLTQKMAKEVFLIKSNIDIESNIKKLTQSSQLFDRTLKGLIAGDKGLHLVATKDTKIQKQLNRVVSIWKPFHKEIKDILKGKEYKKSYLALGAKSDELLYEMNRAVELYAQQDKKSNFRLANDMNLAGKQRMLLEKMSKSILIANHGLKSKKYQNDFIKSKELFAKILKGLSKGDSSLKLRGTKLPMINQQLKHIEKLWIAVQNRLQTALKGKSTKKAIVALDNIVVETDKSVKLYTKSLKRTRQRDEFASLIKVHTSFKKMDEKTKLLLERLAKAEVE